MYKDSRDRRTWYLPHSVQLAHTELQQPTAGADCSRVMQGQADATEGCTLHQAKTNDGAAVIITAIPTSSASHATDVISDVLDRRCGPLVQRSETEPSCTGTHGGRRLQYYS